MSRRARPLLLVLALLALAAPGPRADQPPAAGLEKELELLFAYVEGFDEELRETALRRLVEIGAPAVPHIARRLGTRGGDHYKEALARIRARGAAREKDRTELPARAAQLEREKLLADHWDSFLVRWLEKQVDRVRDLAARGRHADAIERIEALLLLEPGMPEATKRKLKELRGSFKEERFAAAGIAGDVETDKRVYTFGEPLRLVFTVTNHSAQQFLIRASLTPGEKEKAAKEARDQSVIAVHYRVTDYHLDGNALLKEHDADVPLSSDVTLSKDQKWRRAWSLPQPAWPGEGYVYREIEVSAQAIPVAMSSPGVRHDQTKLRFPPQRFRVFPANFESLASDPLGALRGALRFGRPREAYVAALLVAPHQQRDAVELLVEALGAQAPELARTSIAALERLTGQRLGPSVDAWRLWWKANRERWQPPAAYGKSG